MRKKKRVSVRNGGQENEERRKRNALKNPVHIFDSDIYGISIAIINIKMLFSVAICSRFYCPLAVVVAIAVEGKKKSERNGRPQG